MSQNQFKFAFRHLLKNRYYSSINLIGLTLGITCSLILFIFISYHLSFDNYHLNSNRIFRVVTDLHLDDGSIDYDRTCPIVLGEQLKNMEPSINSETILLEQRSLNITIINSKTRKENIFYEEEKVGFTDTNFFKIFSYQWKFGNPQKALASPFTAVITSELAKKYFNNENALGETLLINNKFKVTITGIVEPIVANTDLKSQIFISISSTQKLYRYSNQMFTDWNFSISKNLIFLLLKDENNRNKVNGSIKVLTKKVFGANEKTHFFHLQPLNDIHFNMLYGGIISKSLLGILALVGIIIMAMVSINFINISLAQNLTRTQEIGTRKILGSSSWAIWGQFIIETSILTVAGGLLGLVLTAYCLFYLNRILNTSLFLGSHAVLLLIFIIILIIISAGFYPAWLLSRLKPVHSINSNIRDGYLESKWIKGIFILSQNIIAQTLLICTLLIYLQVIFLLHSYLGFNKNSVLMVPLPENPPISQLSFLRNQIDQNLSVNSISFCLRPPSTNYFKAGSVRLDGKEWEKFVASTLIGDENYIKTFSIPLLAGRNFIPSDTAKAYLVNQELALKLGFHAPYDIVGHTLFSGDLEDQKGIIIGVVKDFHEYSLNSIIQPCLIAYKPNYYSFAAIKISKNQPLKTIQFIQKLWMKAFPKNVFAFEFLDKKINDLYQQDQTIEILVISSAIMAIFIACLGLLGLISLNIVQRTKEIGIRKVLGASTSNTIYLLSKDYLRWILLGLLISVPLSYWIMNNWLNHYAYHIEIKWWMISFAGLAGILITFITILFQAFLSAQMNPVESIRN